MSNIEKIKAVRIMCDFEGDGVWSAPIPNSTLEGFRVSDALWQRIQRWQRWHDSQDGRLCPDPNFDLKGFVAEGYVVARLVKAELPDWIVLYSDEALLEQSIETGDDSIQHLVEIT